MRKLTARTSGDKSLADNLIHTGWGIVGQPKDGVIVDCPSGPGIDVTGYHVTYYFDGTTEEHKYDPDKFLGPDIFGIVPIFRRADGSQFPIDAKSYPFWA